MRRTEELADTSWTAILGIVFATLFAAWILGIAVFNLTWLAPWMANRNTEIQRNTNQYVDTQQYHIYSLIGEYDKLNNYEQTEEIDRQQVNLVREMCEAANKIDRQYVPEGAIPLMSKEGCYEDNR